MNISLLFEAVFLFSSRNTVQLVARDENDCICQKIGVPRFKAGVDWEMFCNNLDESRYDSDE